jgi:hypothetical protein
MIVQITPISISNIGWKTYMIFFVMNIGLAITVWLFYPETAGRTLEEIDYMYAGDCDRLFVVGRNGRTLPGFRSMMDREDPERTRAVATTSEMVGGRPKVNGLKQLGAEHFEARMSQSSSSNSTRV